ncbi:MAG: hypothetical protein ACE5I7_20005 [Candidatus Binatia bacterium]
MDRRRALIASREEVRRLAGQRLSEVTPSRRDFAQYVSTGRDGIAIIARLAPTESPPGHRWGTAELVAHACACDAAEVAALAVATGPGELSSADLAAVAAATTAPILRDDLLIDPRQLYDARLHGADAVVLPAGDLDREALRELVAIASSLHMAAVVEVLSDAEVDAALKLPHVIFGLRALDSDHALDVGRTIELARRVPRQHTAVCLPEVAAAAALHGHCDAILAGRALTATDSLSSTVERLRSG